MNFSLSFDSLTEDTERKKHKMKQEHEQKKHNLKFTAMKMKHAIQHKKET